MGWLPAIAILILAAWLNLIMWAARQPSPPTFFRFLFAAWEGLKGALGIHRMNERLAGRRASTGDKTP